METPQPLGNQFQGSKATLMIKKFLLQNSRNDAACDTASSPFAVCLTRVWPSLQAARACEFLVGRLLSVPSATPAQSPQQRADRSLLALANAAQPRLCCRCREVTGARRSPWLLRRFWSPGCCSSTPPAYLLVGKNRLSLITYIVLNKSICLLYGYRDPNLLQIYSISQS